MADFYVLDEKGNRYNVLHADLLLPQFGNWTAHVNFGGTKKIPSGKVVLHWYDTDWNGYILRSGIQNQIGTAVVVGGKGGLWKENPQKMYDYSVSCRLPITEILQSCGETLSLKSDPQKLATYIPNWIRRQTTAGQQLSDICNAVDVLWCLEPDGSVYIGNYAYTPVITKDFNLIAHDPTLLYSKFNAFTGKVRPGDKINVLNTDYNIAAVHYRAEQKQICSMQLWYTDNRQKTRLDPLRAGMAQFVRETLPNIDYYASYAARVILQRKDGTLDVQFDTKKFPPLTSVPVSVPFPGAKINVRPGDRVLIRFKDGDPTKYVADVYLNSGGGKPLARKGDTVNVGVLVLKSTAPGVYTMTYTDPLGAVQEGLTVNLKGLIATGSTRIEDSD